MNAPTSEILLQGPEQLGRSYEQLNHSLTTIFAKPTELATAINLNASRIAHIGTYRFEQNDGGEIVGIVEIVEGNNRQTYTKTLAEMATSLANPEEDKQTYLMARVGLQAVHLVLETKFGEVVTAFTLAESSQQKVDLEGQFRELSYATGAVSAVLATCPDEEVRKVMQETQKKIAEVQLSILQKQLGIESSGQINLNQYVSREDRDRAVTTAREEGKAEGIQEAQAAAKTQLQDKDATIRSLEVKIKELEARSEGITGEEIQRLRDELAALRSERTEQNAAMDQLREENVALAQNLTSEQTAHGETKKLLTGLQEWRRRVETRNGNYVTTDEYWNVRNERDAAQGALNKANEELQVVRNRLETRAPVDNQQYDNLIVRERELTRQVGELQKEMSRVAQLLGVDSDQLKAVGSDELAGEISDGVEQKSLIQILQERITQAREEGKTTAESTSQQEIAKLQKQLEQFRQHGRPEDKQKIHGLEQQIQEITDANQIIQKVLTTDAILANMREIRQLQTNLESATGERDRLDQEKKKLQEQLNSFGVQVESSRQILQHYESVTQIGDRDRPAAHWLARMTALDGKVFPNDVPNRRIVMTKALVLREIAQYYGDSNQTAYSYDLSFLTAGDLKQLYTLAQLPVQGQIQYPEGQLSQEVAVAVQKKVEEITDRLHIQRKAAQSGALSVLQEEFEGTDTRIPLKAYETIIETLTQQIEWGTLSYSARQIRLITADDFISVVDKTTKTVKEEDIINLLNSEGMKKKLTEREATVERLRNLGLPHTVDAVRRIDARTATTYMGNQIKSEDMKLYLRVCELPDPDEITPSSKFGRGSKQIVDIDELKAIQDRAEKTINFSDVFGGTYHYFDFRDQQRQIMRKEIAEKLLPKQMRKKSADEIKDYIATTVLPRVWRYLYESRAAQSDDSWNARYNQTYQAELFGLVVNLHEAYGIGIQR